MRKAIGWVGGIKRPPAEAGGLVVEVFWRSAEQSLGFGQHVLHRQAEFLEAGAAGGGGAEAVHGDAVAIQADETVLAEGLI